MAIAGYNARGWMVVREEVEEEVVVVMRTCAKVVGLGLIRKAPNAVEAAIPVHRIGARPSCGSLPRRPPSPRLECITT